MILDLDEQVSLDWKPVHREAGTLRCLYFGTASTPTGWVSLAPGAASVLFRRIRRDVAGECTCVDTSSWEVRWRVPLPPFDRDVGCRFLTSERYIIAAREVFLYQASELIWETHLPTPIEFQPDETRWVGSRDESEWMLISCGDPTAGDELVHVRTHWAKRLGSNGYFFESEWDDRLALETLSLRDGQWIRREEVQSVSEPSSATSHQPLDACRLTATGGLEVVHHGSAIGMLESSPELRIVDADVSITDRRLVVVLADGRFAFFEIVD